MMRTDRRKFLQDSLTGSAGLLFSALLYNSCSKSINYEMLNSISENAPYTMKHLRGNVGYFTERGGTIGWITSGKKSAIIDTQFPDQVKNLLTEIKKLTDDKIEAVFNTHHHSDHTSGNITLKTFASDFIAHENSYSNQKAAAIGKKELSNVHLPNITFKEKYDIKIGTENIRCQYYGAGHTNGDIVVHMQESNVVHIGDLVFNRRFPYIDKGAGASIKNWITVLDKINSVYSDDALFLCGHAGQGYNVIINKDDIKAFQNYLDKLLVYGTKCQKEGIDLETAKRKTKVIPGAEEWKGDGIERSLDAVFAEMNGL